MQRNTAENKRPLFTVLAVVGAVVLVAAVVLIVLDPSDAGPYCTAVSGLSVLVASVGTLVATRRTPED